MHRLRGLRARVPGQCNAIFAEEDVPADEQHFIALNAELTHAPGWKTLAKRHEAFPDADEWNGVRDKLKYLER